MKMVAASRLRRAQEQAEAARPYAQRMERVLASLAAGMAGPAPAPPPLLAGTGSDDVASARRRDLGPRPRRRLQRLDPARDAAPRSANSTRPGKTVKILTIGRKGRDGLRRDYGRLIHRQPDRNRPPPAVVRGGARHRRARSWRCSTAGEFDVCTIVYNRFRSAITPDRHGAAADPVRAARSGGETAAAARRARSTNSSRRRRRSSAELLPQQPRGADLYRAAWKTRRASRARG